MSSNGRTLGTAFEEFNKNDMTYFPVLTLSNHEHVSVNLGERPFKFPVLGSKPIISNSATLIDYYKLLEKNISLLIDTQISLQNNVSPMYVCHYIYIFNDNYQYSRRRKVRNILIKKLLIIL